MPDPSTLPSPDPWAQPPPPPAAATPAGPPPHLVKFGQQMEGIQAADEAAHQQYESALARPMSALSRTMGQPMPQPPAQQKAPQAPDAAAYQKDAMAWASAMAVLGAVSSRFARIPGTAALSAFGASLKGWQEGNQQAYENASKQWEQNNKATIENNRTLLEKYRLVLENRKINIDEQMSRIQLLATQYHDKLMYDAAAAKNYTLVAQTYEKQFEFTEKANEAGQKLAEKREEQRVKNEQSATYWLSPDGQTKMATLPPSQQAAIKQMIDLYEKKGVGRSAIAQDRQQFINEYTDENGVAPTSEQITDWEADRSSKTSAGTAIGRRAGGIAVAVQEAHDTIPNVLAAAEKSAGKGYATWNKIENRWNVEKGDADFAYYVQQLNSLINLYGRVISGGGKGTVSDLEHGREMLNANMPLSAVKGALKGFTTEIDIAEKAPAKARASMRGGGSSAAPPSAAAPAASEGKVIKYDDQGNRIP